MPITLYGNSISGNCLKTKWTAERLGIPYRWVEIDILRGESRTPEFLALNPVGQVPVMQLEDGRTLAQSNAIILYLAEGSRLVPTDAYDRARMLEWLFWEQYSHEPYIAVVRFQIVYRGRRREEIDPALMEGSHAALARLDDALRDRRFLVGDGLTLADIALVAYTRFAPQAGFDFERYPAVRRWIGTVEEALGLEALG